MSVWYMPVYVVVVVFPKVYMGSYRRRVLAVAQLFPRKFRGPGDCFSISLANYKANTKVLKFINSWHN